MTRTLFCIKLNQEAEGLKAPPFPGDLGQKIYMNVSQQAWSAWLAHQTMLINEYRLNLMEPQTKIFLKEEMTKYFFGEGSEAPQGYVPKE